MYKCDFHLHTIPTNKDSYFEFKNEYFKNYLENSSLDCVAITNHNIFDKEQYLELKKLNQDVQIFPGIEIDVKSGHIIIISNPDYIDDFVSLTKDYSILNNDKSLKIEANEIIQKFGNENFLIIPHYNKHQQLDSHELRKYDDHIFLGEVSNAAKFYRMKKNKDEKYYPWLSSDIRITEDNLFNGNKYTYVDASGTTFEEIRRALKNKRMFLDVDKTDIIVDSNLEIKYHPNLNVVLGGRSSGKSHLLREIYDTYNSENNKIQYIRQFSLLDEEEYDRKEEKGKQRRFTEKLEKEYSPYVEKHKTSFSTIVTNIIDIDYDALDSNFESYTESVVRFAKEHHAHDSFSSHEIYSFSNFESIKTEYLKSLIDSSKKILFDKDYKEIFDMYFEEENFLSYIKDLSNELDDNLFENLVIRDTNELLNKIKLDFKAKSSIEPIEEFSVLDYFEKHNKIKYFDEICHEFTKDKVIFKEIIGNKFKIRATKRKIETAAEMQVLNGRKQFPYADGVKLLDNNQFFEFVKWCKDKDYIDNNNIHNLFVTIEYSLLNEYDLPVSGGERTEYNLAKALDETNQYDMLLIDEPESSFDNLFLNEDFNNKIREISNKVPVFIATHNNTIGASLNPNYYIYTDREIIGETPVFEKYFGKSGHKKFISYGGIEKNSHELIMDRLEAGKEEYKKRGEYYGHFKERK